MRCALLALTLVAAACGTPGSSAAEKDAQQARSPRDQMRFEEAIAQRRVLLGMTKKEVLEAWGPPARKRRTRYRSRLRENWVYAFSDLYFDDGGYLTGYSSAGG